MDPLRVHTPISLQLAFERLDLYDKFSESTDEYERLCKGLTGSPGIEFYKLDLFCAVLDPDGRKSDIFLDH